MNARFLCRDIAYQGPHLALCTSQKQFETITRRIKTLDRPPFLNAGADATTHIFTSDSGEKTAIVCLGSTAYKTPIEVACLLVHEAVHIWQAYCDRIGERSPGQEQEAYAIQSISQYLMIEYVRQAINPDFP